MSQSYLSIYLSILNATTFVKTGVYIYIYIFSLLRRNLRIQFDNPYSQTVRRRHELSFHWTSFISTLQREMIWFVAL